MKVSRRALTALFSISIALSSTYSYAVYPVVPLAEIAQTADLIFAGTVASIDYKTSDSKPYTEATFEQVEIINATSRSRQANQSVITLRYAGGQTEDGQFLSVSNAPRFQTGRRYMVFALDDGKNYLTPVVGGSQGMFEIVNDAATQTEVLVQPGGRAVVGLQPSGIPATIQTPAAGPRRSAAAPPVAAGGVPTSPNARISATVSERSTSSPLNTRQFRKLVQESLEKPVPRPRLIINGDGNGKYVRTINGKQEFYDLTSTATQQMMRKDAKDVLNDGPGYPAPAPSASPSPAPEPETSSISERGQALSTCGYLDLPIRMEQVPSHFWEHDYIQDSMDDFNRFVHIFESYPRDGGVGNNNQNEYGGAAPDSFFGQYIPGWTWDGASGVCFTYRLDVPCGKITQSDVYWNPSYTYAVKPEDWFNSSNNYENFVSLIAHETGHAWGFQTNATEPELYDYDYPSVMHGGYNNVFETGRGIHVVDALALRQTYSNQRTPSNIMDFGIESYYAQDGLKNSTISDTTVGWGDTINISNVVVENMSNFTVSDINVRFYLSNQMNFEGAYHQIGGDNLFTPFGPGSLSTVDFDNIAIPNGTPTGTYYLLAYADRLVNGSRLTDDFGDNNTAVFAQKITVSKPNLLVNKSSLTNSAMQGQNAGSQTFTVRNGSGGKLDYGFTVSYNQTPGFWLMLSPTSGSSTGEADTITVEYYTSDLAPGTYTADITIRGQTDVGSRTLPVTLTVVAFPAPPNDKLADAKIITGLTGTDSATNMYATLETDEPRIVGMFGSHSVWWSWTAPAYGTATIDTIGSNFDTLLAVYTGGSSMASLQLVLGDDQSGGNDTSKVTFVADYDTTYKIAVDGWNQQTGTVKLNWNLEPLTSGVSDWSVY